MVFDQQTLERVCHCECRRFSCRTGDTQVRGRISSMMMQCFAGELLIDFLGYKVKNPLQLRRDLRTVDYD